MKIVVIIGGNKLAKYLSSELKKKNYKVYYFSRRYNQNNFFNKTIKVKSYSFKNL